MLFKNPALLYCLFFLIVPVIVHLFQLRRFQKTAFTNVAFLKPLITKTRKSRQLKKWLTLFTRLLITACLVLAFAQPFLPGSDIATREKETVIYLDNSYSMQAAGQQASLYDTAISDLLELLPSDKVFSLFTNDQVFAQTNKQRLSNRLLNLPLTAKTLTYEQVQLKAQSLFNQENSVKELIMLSDFQKQKSDVFPEAVEGIKRSLVQLKPEVLHNIALDTVYVADRTGADLSLEVVLSSNYEVTEPITLSMYNGAILLAKTSLSLENKKGTARFELELSEPIAGHISIDDEGLDFDNTLYLSTNPIQKIKVLSINGSDSNFLDRLYTGEEFEHIAVQENDVNYNLISSQHLVILNELEQIPEPLTRQLNQMLAKGGALVYIPSDNLNSFGYPGSPRLEPNDYEKRITQISFAHPLLKQVFNSEVRNFQYPRVATTMLTKKALSPILSYEDGSSFLYQQGQRYIFTAPLNLDNSNFQNSPLIVPIFYNMAVNALPVPELYYELGTTNEIAIPVVLSQDHILRLQQDEKEVIPVQRAFDDYVLISSGSEIEIPGNYRVMKEGEPVANISYNLDRSENQAVYFTPQELGDHLSTSVSELLEEISQEENILSLWKYFILGALFFLICELLILKYLK